MLVVWNNIIMKVATANAIDIQPDQYRKATDKEIEYYNLINQ